MKIEEPKLKNENEMIRPTGRVALATALRDPSLVQWTRTTATFIVGFLLYKQQYIICVGFDTFDLINYY